MIGWISALPLYGDPAALVSQGRKAFESGDFRKAATDWEKAVEEFRTVGDPRGDVAASVSLAGAYQSLGQQRRAVQILEEALKRAEKTGDSSDLLLVKSRLGASLILTLDFDRAQVLLRESLEAARVAGNLQRSGEIQNDLGNLLSAQQKFTEASAAFAEAASLSRQAGDAWLTAQAYCNAATSSARAGSLTEAEALNSKALQEIAGLGTSHAKSFLLLTAGQTDRQVRTTNGTPANHLLLRANQSFRQALEAAEGMGDLPVTTYALGYLGQLYEQDGQPDVALDLTRRAIFAAQQAQMPEALYQWEWQSGRLLKARNEIEQAVAAYRRAVQSLEPIRNDVALGYGNHSIRRSFREAQGPLFFELADLLLLQATAAKDPHAEQVMLREARDTVERLKSVELEDYLCDDCVNVQRANTKDVEAVDQHTAVVYLIPLPKRTEILVGVTSGLKRFTVDMGSDALTTEVRQFRRNLETRTTYGYLAQGQQLYDWLIRPIRPFLVEHHIDTLVFVPDGALRTIPFASLHDGERFLIQEFAVAVVPGLSLVEPLPLERGKARMLLNGLSESVQGFPGLSFVPGELKAIETLYPGDTLLNQGFLLKDFSRHLTEDQYSIVHIASHGQFDRDVKKTFVLTYDSKLTLNDLEAMIRPSQYRGRPVELLVLSA
ncbi:MAG: hypothetical protein RIS76_2514, partial [Verrucomicrobiota bacterium]